ncbi:MAG TPA: DUF2911 domain-containing protein [Longimicrobiales bacterium]|nr:DUF2911 domain-containing protein [Longimicrobiales bacterium]
MRRDLLAATVAALVLLIVPADGVGQIRGSEASLIGQTIDGTTIKLEYSRPRAAGRELFGGIVPWGVPWTGANWATTLEIDKPIRINGTDVPAGKYSVWWVPRADQKWTVFLDPNAKLFHFQKPDSTVQQIRIAAQPEKAAHVELLTWSFPALTGDAATLRMQWGTTAVPLQIVVQPSKPVELAAEDRALYLGSYDLKIPEGLGWPTTGRLDVFAVGALLRGRMPFPIHPGDELEFDLVPAGPHRFSPALYRGGKLFNIEMGGTFEFDVEGKQARIVRLRGIEGSVFAEGQRSGK